MPVPVYFLWHVGAGSRQQGLLAAEFESTRTCFGGRRSWWSLLRGLHDVGAAIAVQERAELPGVTEQATASCRAFVSDRVAALL